MTIQRRLRRMESKLDDALCLLAKLLKSSNQLEASLTAYDDVIAELADALAEETDAGYAAVDLIHSLFAKVDELTDQLESASPEVDVSALRDFVAKVRANKEMLASAALKDTAADPESDTEATDLPAPEESEEVEVEDAPVEADPSDAEPVVVAEPPVGEEPAFEDAPAEETDFEEPTVDVSTEETQPQE